MFGPAEQTIGSRAALEYAAQTVDEYEQQGTIAANLLGKIGRPVISVGEWRSAD